MALNSQIQTGIACLLLSLPAAAQIELNPAPDPSVIRMDVDLVNLLCTVRDKNGNYVKDLSKDDFTVLDDGRRQAITHFAREVDTPLTVALLLDVSGSVTNVLDQETAAANQFFSHVLRPGDRALLVGFAQYVVVWQDLTSSRENLARTLEERAGPMPLLPERPPPRAGTLLRDAVNMVALQKLRRIPGRKVMVLITDGEDNGSRVTLDADIQAAQQSDAVIYGIHYEDAGASYGTGQHVLELLSGPTGGRTFHVSKKMTLENVFSTIEEEMRNQYAIGYPLPGKTDVPVFHKVDVKVLRPGLKVQTRNGYYSAPK
jgi:VWFA-related protein